MRKAALAVASAVALLQSAPSFAEPALVDQVERLDVERGEAELELQSIYAVAAVGEGSIYRHIFSGEYGLSNRISLGFELGADAQAGAALSAQYVLLQAKFIAFDPRSSPFGLGVQASLGQSLNSDGGEAELEILAEKNVGAFAFASDVTIERELRAGAQPLYHYALRSDWRRPWGVLGLEAGGDLSAPEDGAGRHWFGPLVAFQAKAFSVELSYFRGLNDETPDDQFRIQIDLRREN